MKQPHLDINHLYNLLDHLILVLDEQLDSLNGGSGSLGDTSSHAGEHEGLKEPKFLVCHLELCGVLSKTGQREI